MSLADKRILMAEDNPVSAMILGDMLTALGCRVASAADGQEALEQLEQKPVDLILMDCRMPNLDGYQATLRIRADPRFANLPIIAVTAEQGEQLQQCLDVGMNQVLTKPVGLEDLRIALKKWLVGHGETAKQAPPTGNSDRSHESRAVFAEESGIVFP